MNTTIKDIARETGLSTATISKYLNHKKIREENRTLIEGAIQKLNYKPNRTAQILRTKKARIIGILLTDLGSSFWAPLVNSITRYFMKYHYAVITCAYSFNPGQTSQVIQKLISQKPDGIIILPNAQKPNLYTQIQKAKIPFVLLDTLPAGFRENPVDCVTSDNYGGGALLARHLLENGHTNVAVMDRPIDSYPILERIRGFTDVYREYGYTISDFPGSATPIFFDDTQLVMEYGKKRFLQVMDSPEPPTAIFLTNYTIGIGVLTAAYPFAAAIPEKVSLVCFDDDPIFKVTKPSLTCVSQDLKQIGEKASEILLRRIHGDYSDFPSVQYVDVTFHNRQSVKKLTL